MPGLSSMFLKVGGTASVFPFGNESDNKSTDFMRVLKNLNTLPPSVERLKIADIYPSVVTPFKIMIDVVDELRIVSRKPQVCARIAN